MSESNEININLEKKGETAPEVIGVLMKPNTRIYGEQRYYYYETGYYGVKTEEYLELYPEETLLLMERNRLKLVGSFIEEGYAPDSNSEEKQPLSELSLAAYTQYITSIESNFWGRYLVYKDLRARGYVVRPGYGTNAPYRRYPRGTKAERAQSNILVYPFVEGTKLELYELEQLVQQALSNRKQLILGIVDRSGDVTYYKASEFVIPDNDENYEWLDELKTSDTIEKIQTEDETEYLEENDTEERAGEEEKTD
jgi:tRNA-intron endonuclease